MRKGLVEKGWMAAACLMLVVLVSALYGRFLESPLVFDDTYPFMLDTEGRSPIFDYLSATLFDLRGLPYASLAWTVQIFGFGLLPLRIGNLILHLAVVITLYFFLRSLFRSVLPVERLDDGHWIAFFAALLFGLHPVAVYSVGYLIQRSTEMATLFSLLAMLCYLHGSIASRRRWLWASVLFYYLAVFSKEHAIMLPAVLVALELLLHADGLGRIRRNWPVFLAYAVIAFLVVLGRKYLLGEARELDAGNMLQELGVVYPYPMSILTQCWLFFKYGALWLLPNPEWISVDMREPFATSWMSPYLAAPLLFLAYGWVAVKLLLKRGKIGLLGFALLFPWLMFMTELVSVRIQEPFVLYRSYLWAVGAAAALPVLVGLLRRPVAVTILSLVALAYFPVATERLGTFSHPFLLWDDAEKLVHGRNDRVGAYRIYYNRGGECIKILDFACAATDLKRSIALYPGMPEAYGNLGSVYLQTGRLELAKSNLDQAIRLDNQKGQSNWRHHWWRAQANAAMHRDLEAALDYAVTCELVQKGCDKMRLPIAR